MRLHHLGSLGTALYNIRINSALSQEVDAVQLTGLFLKDTDKLATDNLTLLLGVGYACQLIQETICSIHINKVSVQLILENFDNGFRLTLTHQSMIHMYAHQIVTDSF